MSDEFDRLSSDAKQAIQRAAVASELEYTAFAMNRDTTKTIENVLARHSDEVQRAKEFNNSLTEAEKKALDFVAVHAIEAMHDQTTAKKVAKDLFGIAKHPYMLTQSTTDELKHAFTPAASQGTTTRGR